MMNKIQKKVRNVKFCTKFIVIERDKKGFKKKTEFFN